MRGTGGVVYSVEGTSFFSSLLLPFVLFAVMGQGKRLLARMSAWPWKSTKQICEGAVCGAGIVVTCDRF